LNLFLGTLTRIWSEEGIRGLYRGLGPTIFGYLPTWAIYFTAYDYFKDLVAKQTGKETVQETVAMLLSSIGNATEVLGVDRSVIVCLVLDPIPMHPVLYNLAPSGNDIDEYWFHLNAL